jgi:hypothetical protein
MASPGVLCVISVLEFDVEGQGLEVSKRGCKIGDEIMPILQADRESTPTRLQPHDRLISAGYDHQNPT